MIFAVVFDMDGLLVDTERVMSEAWGQTLIECRVQPTLNECGTYHRVGVSTGYQTASQSIGETDDLRFLRNAPGR